MVSMTGYAAQEWQTDRALLAIELKSYNNRYLDIQINLPPSLSALEPAVREAIGGYCRRGRVEAYFKLRERREELQVFVDDAAARAYADALRRMGEALDVEGRPSLDHLIRMEGVIKTERVVDSESYWEEIEPRLEAALEALDRSRRSEGERMREHIVSLLGTVERGVGRIDELAPQIEAKLKESIQQRFQEVLGNEVEHDRVLTETAVLLVRYSIEEEVARLRSHLTEFRSTLESGESIGKRLDFTAQEMNREINTIGSKTPLASVSSAVVEIKHALESIREQLRNIE